MDGLNSADTHDPICTQPGPTGSTSGPPHVHVLRDEKEAKVWLQPVALEYARGYSPSERNRVLRLTRQHQAQLLEAWYGHCRR